MFQGFRKFRITIILALCLLIMCGATITPWAVKGRNDITFKAEAFLDSRVNTIRDLQPFIFEEESPSVNWRIDGHWGIDDQEYAVDENGDASIYVSSDSFSSDPEYDDGRTYHDDTDDPEDGDGNDDPTILDAFEEAYRQMLMDTRYYRTENGEVFGMFAYTPGGLTYREECVFTMQSFVGEDGQVLRKVQSITLTNPLPVNSESKGNEDLRDVAVKELMGTGKSSGWKDDYRFRVFKVAQLIDPGDASIRIVAQPHQDPMTPELEVSELYDSTHTYTLRNENDDGGAFYVYLTVFLFEDCGPAIRVWRETLFKNVLCALIFCAAIVMISYSLERKKHTSEVPVPDADEDSEGEHTSESTAPKKPGAITGEKAKELLSRIDLAEQSMGPNGYLEQLRDDIHELAGIERADVMEISSDPSDIVNMMMPGDPADVPEKPDFSDKEDEPGKMDEE